MITESLIEAIDRGREGKEQGLSIGLPKLEQYVDGICKGVYTLVMGESGTGSNYERYLEYCRLYEKSNKLLETKITEDCNVNHEVITETKESVTPQRIEIEPDKSE